MPTTHSVALLIEATNGYARGLLNGVARYTHENPGWTVYFEPHALDEPPPKWLKTWKGDGILARVGNRRTAKAVLAVGVPVVELRRMFVLPGIPAIGPDHRAVAGLAVGHLLERGFRHFGFCGLPRGVDPPLDDRADAVREHLRGLGFPCNLFPADRKASWDQDQKRLVRWIRALPKPAGVMTCNDNRGLQVLRACTQAGVAVPDRVAVVGAGNDDCLCNLSHPPLSSVDLAAEAIGYEAAVLLAKMMTHHPPSSAAILVPPRGIITRFSSDVLATEDEAVSRAVGFIRNRARDDIRVSDVLAHVKLSRSGLEPRLKQVLGRTIHQEIHHVRIERVKTLLATTNLPTKQIAGQTGFHSVQYLTRVFRKATGQTPAGYRRRMRK